LIIAMLVGVLSFNFSRLIEIRREFQKEALYSVIWPVMQAQYQAMRLADALAPEDDGKHSPPMEQLDITIGNLSVLFEGEYRQVMIEYGELARAQRFHDALRSFEVQSAVADPKAGHAPIRMLARETAAYLRSLANRIVIRNHASAQTLRDRYLQILLETATSFAAVLLASIYFTIGFVRRVNENIRTRQLLVEQERLADLVIDNVSSQGIVIFDGSLTCLLWNPGMAALSGIAAADMTGHTLEHEASLFAKPGVRAALLRAAAGTGSVIEDEGTSSLGRERLLEIHSYPLRTDGRQLGIAFILDVSEHWQARRQAERQNQTLEIQVEQRTQALQEAERRLIAAIETAPEGFAAFDPAGTLLFANERLRSAAAEPHQPTATLTDFIARLTRCPAPLAEEGFEEIALDVQLAKESWAHLAVTRADGGTIFMRLTDITQHKLASAALATALDRERETTNTYRSFVSMVSHQFRTPLAILDSNAQRMLRQQGSLSERDLSSRISRMRGAIARLTLLVESVLNAARLDAGQIEFRPGSCHLPDLIRDNCERQRELTPNVPIRLHLPEQAPGVYCDSLLIEQVIMNLLSNAVKYSGKDPTVDVMVWVEGARAYCSVRDKGIGIPHDEAAKIFTRFYRARTASGISGIGIGLNFAQKIIQLHGGTIHVQSREGQGSEFTFDLPVDAAALNTRAA
jgi:PAS domain S-box-containing protein